MRVTYCTNNNKTDYRLPHAVIQAFGTLRPENALQKPSDKNQPFAVFNYVGTHESQNFGHQQVKPIPNQWLFLPNQTMKLCVAILAKLYDNVFGSIRFVEGVLGTQREGEAENTIVFLGRSRRHLVQNAGCMIQAAVPLIIKWQDISNPARLTIR